MRRLFVALSLIAVLPTAAPVLAQGWPDETATLAGGRVRLGGDVTATVAPEDVGHFNATDYGRSALQLVRLGFTADVRPTDRVTFIAELRAEGDTSGGSWSAIPAALYVRVRPWKDLPIDIQAGRIPPVFGVAGRRVYAADNVLIGYPLAWQYLTVLRPDAVPSNANELLYARSAGWAPGYSVGSDGYAHGIPLTTAFRYDSGAEVRFGGDMAPLTAAVAVTAGTLSSPGSHYTNGGPQISTRVAVRPVPGLVLGGSFADGRFIGESVRETLPAALAGGRYSQQTWGADAEYSRGYWLARAELVAARWTLPVLGAPAIDSPLTAVGLSVEGRYRLLPGITLGSRLDHLAFNDQTGTYGSLPWDAPVWRLESGVAWRATRHVTLRGSLQHDTRSRGRVQSTTLPSAQVTVWF